MIGSGHRSSASFVELNLGAGKSFLERFASANSMTLGFSESSEKSWSLNMSGSREVTDEFSKWVMRLGQAAPTQPAARGCSRSARSRSAMARHSPTIRATMMAASDGMIR
jgi:hypothetical protein